MAAMDALTVNILPGSGLHLPEPPMLHVNVPTVWGPKGTPGIR